MRTLLLLTASMIGLLACTPEAPKDAPPRIPDPPVEFASISPTRAESAATTVTWDAARTASVKDLVRLAFQPVGEELVEVSRPGPPLPLFEDDVEVPSLSFATRPRRSGNYGLCEATVVTVPVNRAAGASDTPIRTHLEFKVVGEAVDREDRSDAYERRLDAECARAGPVLPTDTDHYTGKHFFVADVGDGNGLRFAIHALQMALAKARSDPRSIACAGASHDPLLDCRRPWLAVDRLKIGDLSSVKMRPCPSRGDYQCVEAHFADWEIELEAHVQEMGNRMDVRDVKNIRIWLQVPIS